VISGGILGRRRELFVLSWELVVWGREVNRREELGEEWMLL
jgi:hypothetical protein